MGFLATFCIIFDLLYVFLYGFCFVSLYSGIYPDVLKFSSITPIFKSGDISDVNNDRPITILSFIGKLFDLLVLKYLLPSVNPVLIDEQHGFRSGRSVTTYNLVFVNHVFDAFNNGNQVDVIYTDFRKAFDRVNH